MPRVRHPLARPLILAMVVASCLALAAIHQRRSGTEEKPPIAAPPLPVQTPVPPPEAESAKVGSAAELAAPQPAAPLTPLPASPPVPVTAAAADLNPPAASPFPGSDLTARPIETLRSDTVVLHRLNAVDELRLLGMQGDPGDRIRNALQSATSDPDPTVAVSARDALSVLQD